MKIHALFKVSNDKCRMAVAQIATLDEAAKYLRKDFYVKKNFKIR